MAAYRDDINWKRIDTPNKGGRPQVRVSFDGQVTTRTRRGKVVEIPEEWRGAVTHPQTIRKRPSKLTRKVRNATKSGPKIRIHGSKRERIEAKAPTTGEYDA